MKSKILIMLLCCFSVLMLNGCGGSGESNDVSEPIVFDPVSDQYQQDAINIASISYNSSVRNAILLGEKHINEAGGVLGKNFNVMSYVASDTDDSVRLAQRLLEVDIKIMNVSYSSRSRAVAELTIPRRILLVSESASSPIFTTLDDDDFYFRMAPSDIYQGQVLAQVALNSGATTAVSIYNLGDSYGETLVTEFAANFESHQANVLATMAIPFSVETGFDSYLQELSDLAPDVIINTLLDGAIAANFVNESAAFNHGAQFIFPDSAAGITAFLNSIANIDIVDGALGTSPGFGHAANPDMIFFADSYTQQFDIAPEGFTVNGYDFALVAALAIEHAGKANNTESPSSEMVRDSLRAVMNPPGEVVSPRNIQHALALVRNGVDIDYSGGYGATDWDENGDIAGEITYDVLRVDGAGGKWVTERQEQIFVPLQD